MDGEQQQPYWIVVRTKPRQEQWARLNIQQAGLDTYLPLFFCNLTKRVRVLFPSYLFVQIKQQWYFLKSTFGVSHLLMWQEAPAVVASIHLRKLRQREEADGLIHLDGFQLRQQLRIKAGPLQGLTGLYDGMKSEDRCRVMLQEFLGQPCTADVDIKAVEAA